MKSLHGLKKFRGLILALALAYPMVETTRIFAVSAEELRTHEAKAVAILIAFMTLKKESLTDINLKWCRAIERIIELLKTNPKYAKLCETLRKLQHQKSALKIALELRKHLAELPQEVQAVINKKTPGELLTIFNARI